MTALNAEPATPLTESKIPVNALFAFSNALRELVIPPNPPKLSARLAADIPAPIAPVTSAAPAAALVNAATDSFALFTRFTAGPVTGCAGIGDGISTATVASVILVVAVSTAAVIAPACATASTTASVPKVHAAAIKPAV